MKKQYRFFSLFLFFFLLSLAGSAFLFFLPAFSEERSLSKKDLVLPVNTALSLKVNGLKKGEFVQFKISDQAVCSLSKKGKLVTLSPGKASLSATVFSKKGKKITILKTSVSVTSTFLASSQKDLKKAGTLGNIETVLLKPKKEHSFRLSKGNYHYALHIDAGKQKKALSFTVEPTAFAKEIRLIKGKKVNFLIKGKVLELFLQEKNSDVTIQLKGNKSNLSSLRIEENTNLSLNVAKHKKKKERSDLYISAKSNISIKRKGNHPLSLYIRENADESKITTNCDVQSYFAVPSVLELKKGSEASQLYTLDYRVSLTVDNQTTDEISVQTPSGVKTIPPSTKKTVSGK